MRLRSLVITLVGSNQNNYFENATTFNKRLLKTRVAMHLKNLFYGFVFTFDMDFKWIFKAD